MKRFALLSAATLALAGCAATPPPVSDKVQAYYNEHTAMPTPEVWPNSLFLGDSYTAGSLNTVKWPAVVAGQMKWNYVNAAVGGAGYSNSAGNNLAAQIDAMEVVPDIVVVTGSRNDVYNPEAVKDAATDLYAKLKVAAPEARVVVIGPIWDSTEPSSGAVAANEATKEAATEAGLPFVDALSENWLGVPALIQGDGVHPNDAGQQKLAERIGQKLNELGL